MSALLVDGVMVVGDNLESDPLQTYHCVGSLETSTLRADPGSRRRSCVRSRGCAASSPWAAAASAPPTCCVASSCRPTGQCGVNNVELGLYTEQICRPPPHPGHAARRAGAHHLRKAGWPVELIGKVADVIVCEGAHKEPHVPTGPCSRPPMTRSTASPRGLIAINVQETDLAGHDQNAKRYAECLRSTDEGVGRMLAKFGPQRPVSSSPATTATTRRSGTTSTPASSRRCWRMARGSGTSHRASRKPG